MSPHNKAVRTFCRHGVCEAQYNDAFHGLYGSPHFDRLVKSRRLPSYRDVTSIWRTLFAHRLGRKNSWKWEKMKKSFSKTLRELSVVVHNKAARGIACVMADVGLLLKENGSDQTETIRRPNLTSSWQLILPWIEKIHTQLKYGTFFMNFSYTSMCYCVCTRE
jgi:hypothetical protein